MFLSKNVLHTFQISERKENTVIIPDKITYLKIHSQNQCKKASINLDITQCSLSNVMKNRAITKMPCKENISLVVVRGALCLDQPLMKGATRCSPENEK